MVIYGALGVTFLLSVGYAQALFSLLGLIYGRTLIMVVVIVLMMMMVIVIELVMVCQLW